MVVGRAIEEFADRLVESVRTRADNSNQVYSDAARLLGLPPPTRTILTGRELTGTVTERQVEISETLTPGKRGITYVVTQPPVGLGLRIVRHFWTNNIGRNGWAAELFDDREFTDKFNIETHSPEAIVEFLTPELRAQLLTLLGRYPTLAVTETKISAELYERPKSGEQIAATVNELVDLSCAIAGPGPSAQGVVSQPTGSPAP